MVVERYWTPDFNAEFQGSEQDAIEALRTTLESSVALRMQSDVPLGAFLSGGVDSSLIVAIMQRLATQPVQTFRSASRSASTMRRVTPACGGASAN